MLCFDRASGTRQAAQLGFYVLMTFPALLLLAVWALSALFNSAEVRADLIQEIINALPLDAVKGSKEVTDLLKGLTQGAGSLGFITILILLYSGSSAIGALRHAVQTASEDGSEGPSFPRNKGLDILTTAVTLPVILLVVGLALSRDLSAVVKASSLLETISGILGGGVTVLVVGVLLLTWLYWILNPGPRTWKSAFAGATVATGLCWLIWIALRTWFSISGGGSAVYGALAGFLGVLLFLNLACIAIVIGAHLAAQFRARRTILG